MTNRIWLTTIWSWFHTSQCSPGSPLTSGRRIRFFSAWLWRTYSVLCGMTILILGWIEFSDSINNGMTMWTISSKMKQITSRNSQQSSGNWNHSLTPSQLVKHARVATDSDLTPSILWVYYWVNCWTSSEFWLHMAVVTLCRLFPWPNSPTAGMFRLVSPKLRADRRIPRLEPLDTFEEEDVFEAVGAGIINQQWAADVFLGSWQEWWLTNLWLMVTNIWWLTSN